MGARLQVLGTRRMFDKAIRPYSPEVAATARAALKTLHARFPGARQLVYKRRQSLPIGFAPAGRGSAVFSLVSAEGFTKVGRHSATGHYVSA